MAEEDSPQADTPAAPKLSWRRRHWRQITIALVILVPILVFVFWVWLTLGYAYASEDRAGYVQKIARRGWLCKTWEGELASANQPGAMPEIFRFTVRNDSLAHVLERNLGKRVTLTYEQHRGVPTSCFGETQDYITNVRIEKD
jgi:hypothetical protein